MPIDRNATFFESMTIFSTGKAEFFAGELFRQRFGQPFPVPRYAAGLRIATPPENWHQYVAVYRWPHGLFETVGFCNWIRYGQVYLEGGMCVKEDFYRRLPREQWQQCKASGGVAQSIMETAAQELDDGVAWFGYCGDKKALAVDKRVGYAQTRFQFLIVKWFKAVPEREQDNLIESIARIGPF